MLAEAGSREKHQEASFLLESQCKSSHQIILAEANTPVLRLFGRKLCVCGSLLVDSVFGPSPNEQNLSSVLNLNLSSTDRFHFCLMDLHRTIVRGEVRAETGTQASPGLVPLCHVALLMSATRCRSDCDSVLGEVQMTCPPL